MDLNKIGWDDVELNLPDGNFGRWHVDAVDCDIRQAWLGTADLHVLAFAFVALERDPGQAAHSIGNVGIAGTGSRLCSRRLR